MRPACAPRAPLVPPAWPRRRSDVAEGEEALRSHGEVQPARPLTIVASFTHKVGNDAFLVPGETDGELGLPGV